MRRLCVGSRLLPHLSNWMMRIIWCKVFLCTRLCGRGCRSNVCTLLCHGRFCARSACVPAKSNQGGYHWCETASKLRASGHLRRSRPRSQLRLDHSAASFSASESSTFRQLPFYVCRYHTCVPDWPVTERNTWRKLISQQPYSTKKYLEKSNKKMSNDAFCLASSRTLRHDTALVALAYEE